MLMVSDRFDRNSLLNVRINSVSNGSWSLFTVEDSVTKLSLRRLVCFLIG